MKDGYSISHTENQALFENQSSNQKTPIIRMCEDLDPMEDITPIQEDKDFNIEVVGGIDGLSSESESEIVSKANSYQLEVEAALEDDINADEIDANTHSNPVPLEVKEERESEESVHGSAQDWKEANSSTINSTALSKDKLLKEK